MNIDEREKFEWEIRLLREQIDRLWKTNAAIRRSKTIAKILMRNGKNFRVLQVLESHPSIEGITLVVKP